MRKCYYCQSPISVSDNCDYHSVIVLHQFSNKDKLKGIALATNKYEVYLNFEDQKCEIYTSGRLLLQLKTLPNFTPENMIDKIKTYVIFS